jgi:glutamate synthase domain-containing protein 3
MVVNREQQAPATVVDLAHTTLRELNARLHAHNGSNDGSTWRVLHPRGAHALAAGLDAPLAVEIAGHAGYYCAGMNQRATVVVDGNAGPGVAENMMSGVVRVRGDASQNAGASAHGGLLVIEGSAAARCGISLKGADIVVCGSVGHLSAFMAQAGTLVVLGDAGDDLGDSLYEAELYVRGTVGRLGADCELKPMDDLHRRTLRAKLDAAGLGADVDVASFARLGSARRLYHFHPDNVGAY